MVFRTDALCVLEALSNNEKPQLVGVLHTVSTRGVALLWVPTHCGAPGNDDADQLAKTETSKSQPANALAYRWKCAVITSNQSAPSTNYSCRTGQQTVDHIFQRCPIQDHWIAVWSADTPQLTKVHGCQQKLQKTARSSWLVRPASMIICEPHIWKQRCPQTTVRRGSYWLGQHNELRTGVRTLPWQTKMNEHLCI